MKRRVVFVSVALMALCLALAGCQIGPGWGAKAAYDVRHYGAVGDGKAIDSRAINRAIEAAAARGGGSVVIPAGTYLCGSIRLKSNIDLHLEPGARIVGLPANSKEFDPAEPFAGTAYQDGGHTYFHNSLIWGENLHNVSITGEGMIDGGGITSRDRNVNDGPIGLGDKAIALKLCAQVLIRDVTIFHGGHFAIITTGCDLLTIDNVTIDTNRDGIDIDCCRNTTVSNCRINSPRDDGLCPKSSFALGRNVPTENLTITNCQVSGFLEGTLLDGTMQPSRQATGRIKFGTEANGGFRNVTISNCTFRNCRGLALEEVDGGILENFTISNLTMMDVASYAIYITTGKRDRGPNVSTPSTLRNISISHVVATGVDRNSGIQITGMAGHPIENVRLDDISIQSVGGGSSADADLVPPELDTGYPEPNRIGMMPAYGVYARHVKGLELANIHLSYVAEDMRPPVACADVQGLEIDNLKAQVALGVAPARFEGVTDLTLRNAAVLQSPGTPILTAPGYRPAATAPTVPSIRPRPATRPADDPDTHPVLPWLDEARPR